MALYNIQKTFYKVADFITWQKNHNLVLTPEFQRRSVWRPGAKSYLIDTIVRGLPIPIIFLRDKRTDPDKYEPTRVVVDGQQRLRTVLGYISPELIPDYDPQTDFFKVQKTHNEQIAGIPFNELDPDIKISIYDYEFVVHILPSKMDDREVIQIFRRMNSTNYTLNKQELINAKYYGEFKTSAYGLATEQINRWKTRKTFSSDDIARMSEVEFTTECISVIIHNKISGKSFPQLENLYKILDETYPFKEEIEKRFRFVMDSIENLFGNNIDLVFHKKTLAYVFFAVLYEIHYGIDSSINEPIKPKTVSNKQISGIKLASERIKTRTAPEEVLDSSDRRTTNPKERNIVFNYILKNIK